jgi:hypothetical protein
MAHQFHRDNAISQRARARVNFFVLDPDFQGLREILTLWPRRPIKPPIEIRRCRISEIIW